MATDTTGRVAAGDRPGGPAGGEPAEQERAALRAAAVVLEVRVEHHGRRERTARQVFWNRPTLRYRTRRFEEPTGRSPQSARDRIEFWLALRGRELAL